jgi:hypothetical protein
VVTVKGEKIVDVPEMVGTVMIEARCVGKALEQE